MPSIADELAVAIAHYRAGRLDDATDLYRGILAREPGNADIHNSLGIVLAVGRRLPEALAAFNQALALDPNHGMARNNLGNVHRELGDLAASAACYRETLQRNPDHALAHSNLGMVLHEEGRLEDAIVHFERAISLQPEYAEARLNLSLVRLLLGDFARGWREFEWRWRVPGFEPAARGFAQPRWQGGKLGGARILLHAEQGVGDTLQFLRYVPLVAARGGRVVLRVQPELARLLAGLEGAETVLRTGDPLPEFACHCPLLSLPSVFQTDLPSIPQGIPYVRPDPQDAARWRTTLGNMAGLRVGLVWSGRPEHRWDRHRSLPMEFLEPLARVRGASFVSLQKGPAAADTASALHGMGIRDIGGQLRDFADTAAAIDPLNLVITVDTAIAHLAGAMGKKVWVLLAKVPDWRWLLDRADSRWYPSARLFRQPAAGDWHSVIDEVKIALKYHLANG